MRAISLFLILTLTCFPAFASEVDDIMAKMKEIAEVRFEGQPVEYKTFSQQQGNALIDTADKMLVLTNLSPEDKRFAVSIKELGIALRYGAEQDEYDQKIGELLESHTVVEKLSGEVRMRVL